MNIKTYDKGKVGKCRFHSRKQILSFIMTLVFLASVFGGHAPAYAAETSVIHVHNIVVGNKHYDNVDIPSATNMFSGKAKETANSDDHRYVIYVGQALDLSATGSSYSFSTASGTPQNILMDVSKWSIPVRRCTQ